MVAGAEDIYDDAEGTVAGLVFAVLGLVVLILSLVACMLKIPAATRDLLRYVQRLEALDREHVDIDLSCFHHLLARTESTTKLLKNCAFRKAECYPKAKGRRPKAKG
eukprot:TRINITY_DN50811_c0_g1_i1.p1 TRINITY_DN50811_c0_g1~~TRINITY_DN50811_c0_g1_i1.p1  ORF type:complete len:107 (-),score=17.17 TRINITY_DN50811_c0_g1_i1:34-354(-)